MKAIRRSILLILLGSLFSITYGCKTLEVDAKLNPDGSGERTVQWSMNEIPEGGLNVEAIEFRKLFHLEGPNWERIEDEKKKEGEEAEGSGKYIYRRIQRAKNLEVWNTMGGDINIQAALDDKRYAKVVIRNTIDVELGTSRGGRSLTYRETVTCTELRQTVFTFMSTGFYNKVSAAYPMLEEKELVELRGLMTGYLAATWYRQGESENEISDEVITESLIEDAKEIISRSHPDADLTELRGIIKKTLDDLEDDLDRFVMENLPGMYLAGHAVLILHLEMPGRIAEHNADEVDGQTLTWKVDLMHTFVKPIEIFARAELED